VIIAGFRLLPRVFNALVGPLLGVLAVRRDDAEATTGNVFDPLADTEATEGPWRSV